MKCIECGEKIENHTKYVCDHGTIHTRCDLERVFKITSKYKQGECWFAMLKLDTESRIVGE